MRKACRDGGGSRRMIARRRGDGWGRKRRTRYARGRALKADVRVRTDQTRIKPRANPWRKRSERRIHGWINRSEESRIPGDRAKRRRGRDAKRRGSQAAEAGVHVENSHKRGGRKQGSEPSSARCDTEYTSKGSKSKFKSEATCESVEQWCNGCRG